MKKSHKDLEKTTLVGSYGILTGKHLSLVEPVMPKQKSGMPYKSFSVRLPEHLLEVVKNEATLGHRSVNAQIEMIIERWAATKRRVKEYPEKSAS